MRLVPASDDRKANVLRIIAFVHTHMLQDYLFFPRRYRATIECCFNQAFIVRICGADGQSNRYPVTFRQQTALGAPLGAIGWIGTGFFPRQAVL